MSSTKMRPIIIDDKKDTLQLNIDGLKYSNFQNIQQLNQNQNPCSLLNKLNVNLFDYQQSSTTQGFQPITPGTAPKQVDNQISPAPLLVLQKKEIEPSFSLTSRSMQNTPQSKLFSQAYCQRTINDISQDLVSCIALCKMFIRNDNQETSDKQALKYLKMLQSSKKLSNFLGIEYSDIATPLVVLDSISDYCKQVYRCQHAVIDCKQIDFKCFERFSLLCCEFMIFGGDIIDNQKQSESTQSFHKYLEQQNYQQATNFNEVIITPQELTKHNSFKDCWVSYMGYVYNISIYLNYHPGGINCLEKYYGYDITDIVKKTHGYVNIFDIIKKLIVGKLDGQPITPDNINK